MKKRAMLWGLCLLLLLQLVGCDNSASAPGSAEGGGSAALRVAPEDRNQAFLLQSFVESPEGYFYGREMPVANGLGGLIYFCPRGASDFYPLCSKPNCRHQDSNCNDILCALILHGSPNPKVLDPMVQTADGESIDESAEYTISQGSAKATGVVTSEGFVLLQGAEINEKVSAKSLNAGIVKLREKYISDGHVQNLVTTEDILFSSSSAAADFVLGYSVSGPKTWKAPDGRTLKEVEESKT